MSFYDAGTTCRADHYTQTSRWRLPGPYAYTPTGRRARQLHQGQSSLLPTCSRALTELFAYKILLATDNHIGYAESDPVRGRDSINTFREILQLAIANDVSCARF